MITIKSNIEFLKEQKDFIADSISKYTDPSQDDLVRHLDYAIETLKMIDKLKDDVKAEK